MVRAHRRGVLSAFLLIPTGTCLGSASSLCFRCFLAALVEARSDDRAPLVEASIHFQSIGQSTMLPPFVELLVFDWSIIKSIPIETLLSAL
ncbi:hypothetical protein TSMEX_004254 [Taenia solium]|eukprot:TsM_000959400 transcript=TsM_000959400 gene=TsM_000959400